MRLVASATARDVPFGRLITGAEARPDRRRANDQDRRASYGLIGKRVRCAMSASVDTDRWEGHMTGWMQDYLDAWNSHDAAKVVAFMADDATYEDLALGQLHEGHAAISAFVDEAEQFSKDYQFTSISEHASGDRYVFEWEMFGTNTGEAGGLPATNRPYRIRGVSVGWLDTSGKIETNRDYWNMAEYLAQVGILPGPPSA